MNCPYCNAPDTKVVDSRIAMEGNQVRRRRECLSCAERFTTYEVVEAALPRVIKRDGNRERFDEVKVRAGMMRALEKRPVASDAIEDALTRIKHKVMAEGVRELPASQVGEWVMQELKSLDQVAYVRYASVYRSFQDVQAFQTEILKLLEGTSKNLTGRKSEGRG
jgi:transcriptional repressor NrdR